MMETRGEVVIDGDGSFWSGQVGRWVRLRRRSESEAKDCRPGMGGESRPWLRRLWMGDSIVGKLGSSGHRHRAM